MLYPNRADHSLRSSGKTEDEEGWRGELARAHPNSRGFLAAGTKEWDLPAGSDMVSGLASLWTLIF